jgi:hypothetical protein
MSFQKPSYWITFYILLHYEQMVFCPQKSQAQASSTHTDLHKQNSKYFVHLPIILRNFKHLKGEK